MLWDKGPTQNFANFLRNFFFWGGGSAAVSRSCCFVFHLSLYLYISTLRILFVQFLFVFFFEKGYFFVQRTRTGSPINVSIYMYMSITSRKRSGIQGHVLFLFIGVCLLGLGDVIQRQN